MHRCLNSIFNAGAACEINFGVKKKGVYWRCVSILRWDSGCQSSQVKILANQSRACCIYNILYLKPASNSKGYKCGGKWTCKKKRTVTPHGIISNSVLCYSVNDLYLFQRRGQEHIWLLQREQHWAYYQGHQFKESGYQYHRRRGGLMKNAGSSITNDLYTG